MAWQVTKVDKYTTAVYWHIKPTSVQQLLCIVNVIYKGQWNSDGKRYLSLTYIS